MDKGQGLTMGIALAAALLLRPGGSISPQEPPPSNLSKSETGSPTAIEVREGPWIASCNYWAPARPAEPLKEKAPEISGAVGKDQVSLHLDVGEANKQQELGCSGDLFDWWGFPRPYDSISATAIIAVVPDPAHTHLALTFDRAMDAILQAAADNGYVSSYFWLPWKNRGGSLKFAGSQLEMEPGHNPERERQPGLVILKHVPEVNLTDSSSGFYKVIYLFIVGETPTQGIDGFQLQNAFSYEAQMKSKLPHFLTGSDNRVAIIGPTLSGSAASLRAGIETAGRPAAGGTSGLTANEFEVAGATNPWLPVLQLTSQVSPTIHYLSFAYDADYSITTFLDRLYGSGYDLQRVALLVEDGTVYGSSVRAERQKSRPVTIKFPREISLLRNAESAEQSGNGAVPPGAVVSPYLHFTVKDYSSEDSVPILSRENTPLSQEAQLMTIARQLHRFRTQFAAIIASNVLDQIFLAQFLHRACPEATLVFFNADLLTVREIDSVPFVGSIAITPYPIMGLGRSVSQTTGRPIRTYPNSSSYSYYNAASYTFWRNQLHRPVDNDHPILEGYQNLLRRRKDGDMEAPPLWATTIGSDSYYPLGILSPCSSDSGHDKRIVPAVRHQEAASQWIDGPKKTKTCEADITTLPPSVIYPSRLWDVLCGLVLILCLLHVAMLLAADYWSPFTRDLAIRDNDQPRRRSMYVHVATAMLLSMAFGVSFPVLWLAHKGAGTQLSEWLGIATWCGGLLAVAAALSKTGRYIGWQGPARRPAERSMDLRRAYDSLRRNAYVFLNLFILMALIMVLGLWGYACSTGSFPGFSPDFAGLSFCYRCINPESGVSPLAPLLLLQFGWYIWGILQTRRLRFSMSGRPWLPGKLDDPADDRYFVSDDYLEQCRSPRDACLYDNITCLMITRQLLCRFRRSQRGAQRGTPTPGEVAVTHQGGHNDLRDCLGIDLPLAGAYGGAMIGFTVFAGMRSVDHFMWQMGPTLPNPYEFLIAALFFPLIALSLAGWLRVIVIWGALRRGVLDRLENLPLRFAFSRLKGMGWMTMLRQGGLHQQWKDMARSLESIGQIVHQPDLLGSSERGRLRAAHEGLLEEIGQIRLRVAGLAGRIPDNELSYDFVRRVEIRFAAFSRYLLSTVLIPYWKNERTGMVESKETELPTARASVEPPRILVAEEFLAIRYLSLIRAVLANLRELMIFVSLSFVLAILAWNSYPFQPRQLLDWFFTGLLAVLGSGVIAVFAQMHRNVLLSRITDTKANELGWDFYLRVVSFGALPVLTWLAYQFPDISGQIYRFIQPVVPVIK